MLFIQQRLDILFALFEDAEKRINAGVREALFGVFTPGTLLVLGRTKSIGEIRTEKKGKLLIFLSEGEMKMVD